MKSRGSSGKERKLIFVGSNLAPGPDVIKLHYGRKLRGFHNSKYKHNFTAICRFAEVCGTIYSMKKPVHRCAQIYTFFLPVEISP